MKSKLVILILLQFSSLILSEVKLPKLISDGMVLQRDTKVNIWGWASAGEEIKIDFLGSIYSTSANDSGEWNVVFENLESGGPFTMNIEASN